MLLAATEVFIGTSLFVLEAIQIQIDSDRLVSSSNFVRGNLELVADKRLSSIQNRNLRHQLVLNRNTAVEQLVVDAIYLDTSDKFNSSLERQNYSTEGPISFVPGVASWQTKTKFGLLSLNGNFDPQAQFTQGQAFWKADTAIGVVDLAVKLNEQLKPTKTTAAWNTDTDVGSLAIAGKFDRDISWLGGDASWNTDTALGSFAIAGKFDRDIALVNSNIAWNTDTALGAVVVKGNFDGDTNFTGGNAAWNAKTTLGSLAIKGDFDGDTNFTGGKVKIATNVLVGFLAADIKLDRNTEFKGADASWNTKLPFGSNFGVNSKFDETTRFVGGSIKLGAKTGIGDLGIDANLNRDTEINSASAFWKTQADFGSIELNADFKQDGNFKSGIEMEFPL